MPATCRRATPHVRRLVATGLLALLLAIPGAAQAFERQFAKGSLLIPTQQEYQTDCGMVSAYGLIYTLLMKNTELEAAGKKPITVYWIIEPKKQSHHRCDTSRDHLPDFSKYNDNDGCDFAIQSASGRPVALLSPTDNATEVQDFSVWTTTFSTTSGDVSRSATKNQAIDANKKVMKYSSGLWVIDATDRQNTLDLLKTADLAKYRSAPTTCPNLGAGQTHEVQIHSSRGSFTAPVAKMINAKPPLIALVGSGFVDILLDYLENAALDAIPNARGTPSDHGVIFDVLEPLTDFISTPTNPRGAINMPVSATSAATFYQVLWAPHWVAGGTNNGVKDVIPADGAPGDDAAGGGWTHGGLSAVNDALQNIAAFSEVGNGIFAECASIESFEGSYKEGANICTSSFHCVCTDNTSDPPVCVLGATAPLAACGAGYTATCGGCYQCPAGYNLDASDCSNVQCVATTPCDAGFSLWGTCDKCYQCPTGYGTWNNPTCDTTTPVCCKPFTTCRNTNRSNAIIRPMVTTPVGFQSACAAGYSGACVANASQISVQGSDPTRFHVDKRISKNALGATFTGRDCSDESVVAPVDASTTPATALTSKYKTSAAISGDCINYHADTGGPGNTFAQKGNFNFDGVDGLVAHYQPAKPVGSVYHPGVLHFAETRNSSNAKRSAWDFVTARHKDADPSKGMIVYLAGHTFAGSPGGNRVVLNTLLNLGFTDSAVELARSEPVAYVTWGVSADGKPEIKAETVFQGTYEQHPPPGPFQDWINYNPAAARSWRFPFIDGHMRAYELAKLATGSTGQAFKDNALWDAAAGLPLPKDRTIFTALGGSANLGWKRVDFKNTQTEQADCVKGTTVDALNNQICLLSEALSQCSVAGVQTTDLAKGDADGSKGKKLGFFVQQVRGHCAAHDAAGGPIMEPLDTECDEKISKYQRNRARLGGVDHASPAIVGPSPYIHDEKLADGTTVAWSKRPVVAYVGARDGMLHAIYVDGDTAWKADEAVLPTGVTPGQELWAFLPPAQLCGLRTNIAMVDANVSVIDVFGNFPKDANGDGVFDLTSATEKPDGVREWRTILVAAAGDGGSELFAMDVTNPLKPALLWHLAGAVNHDDRFDLNGDGDFADAGDHLDKADPATYASTWFNWNDGNASTDHVPTDYLTTSTTVLDALKFGRYDYRNMNKTLGTAVGTVWSGRSFKMMAFLATSTADWADPVTPEGYKGVELFALDLVSGKKEWQWQNRYTRPSKMGGEIADNSIPGRPALVDTDSDGSVDRIYVGDLEGHLWELSALDGRNLNYLEGTDGKRYSFPLFGTPSMIGKDADQATKDSFTVAGTSKLAQQPLTSPIGVGRFTAVPDTLKPYLLDRQALAQGTMGVNWNIAPFEAGHVYVVPAYPDTGTRLLPPLSVSDTDDRRMAGVLLDAANWDIELGLNERVYGMPKIVNNEMFVNTSVGTFADDLTANMYDKGFTYRVVAAGITKIDEGQKRFGGALVVGNDLVITSDTGIVRKVGAGKQPGVDTKVRDRFTPTTTRSWEQRPDGELK